MEIKVQIFGRVYSICIGYKAAWFESASFITIAREWFGPDKQVSYAEMVFRT